MGQALVGPRSRGPEGQDPQAEDGAEKQTANGKADGGAFSFLHGVTPLLKLRVDEGGEAPGGQLCDAEG